MALYISISSIVVVLLSVYIFYFWLKSHNNMNRSTVYFITFLFACAGPLLYHSHKQVMFMDYIPFLLLALVGVDRLYKNDVTVDGELITCEPAKELPLAQRYFLF